MAATKIEFEEWMSRAREKGASHLIVVCDTFDYDDYPVFVMPDEDLSAKRAEFDNVNMQRIMEVVEIEYYNPLTGEVLTAIGDYNQ
jgi:hypothetical protein